MTLPTESCARDAKRRLRVELRRRRLATAALAARGAASALCRNFIAAIQPPGAGVVAGYWPIGAEIDPRPLLVALHRRGFRLALPAVVAPAAPLAFRAWRPGDRLEQGPIGTRQPAPDRLMLVPDVIVVPLLAFDRRGFRLGYGGGFYDRTLALARRRGAVAVGVGYAAQEVAALPTEPFDQRLDWVISEATVMRCPQ